MFLKSRNTVSKTTISQITSSILCISILSNIAIIACKNYKTQQPSTNDFPISTIDNSSGGIEEATSHPTKTFTKERYDIIKKELDEYENTLNTFIQKKSNSNLKNEFNTFLNKATRFIERTDAILQSYKAITDDFTTQTLSTKKNEKVNPETITSTFLEENNTKKVKSKCIKKPLCKSKCVKKSLRKSDKSKINVKTYTYLESIKKELSQLNKKLKSSAKNIGSTFFLIHTNTKDLKNIKEHLKIIDTRWKIVQKSNDHTELSKSHFYCMYENLSKRIAFTIASTNILDKKMIEELKKIKNTVDEKITDLLGIKNIENNQTW